MKSRLIILFVSIVVAFATIAPTPAAAQSVCSTNIGTAYVASVYCFGATGNGSTNDNPAIRTAIAALPNGGTLFFPAGTYLVDTTTDTISAPITISCAEGVTIVPQSSSTNPVFSFTSTSLAGGGGMTGCQMDATSLPSASNTAIQVNSPGRGQVFSNLRIVGFPTAIQGVQGNAVKFNNIRIESCGSGACISLGGGTGVYWGDISWDEIVVAMGTNTATTGIQINGGVNAQYMRRVELIGGGIGLNAEFSSGPANPQNIWCWDCNLDAANTVEVYLQACWMCEFHGTNISGVINGPGLQISASSSGTVDGVSCYNCQIMGNGADGVLWTAGQNVQLLGGAIMANSRASAGTYSGIELQNGARGLFKMQDVIAGLSNYGETGWGHNLNVQAYGLLLSANCLASGRLLVVNNVFSGNAVGAISGTCNPSASALSPNY